MTVTVLAAPPLATVRGVPLMHAGQWAAQSGVHEFTAADLASAVAALVCPAVRRPSLKFGHGGQHGVGMPSIGSVDNMALTDDGRTLVGDYVGMPGWLAMQDAEGRSVLTSAYPDRSIEGEWHYRCQIGHIHQFVVHAVALLGEERPAIGTLPSLADLAELYGVALANPAPTGTPVTLTIRSGEVVAAAVEHTGAMVALVPTAADAEGLAVNGGEPAGVLHVTLAYLGDAADWDAAQRQQLVAALQEFASQGAVEGDGFALSLFNPGRDEPCIVLGLGGQALDDIHTKVLEALDGLPVPEQRAPWQPHITLTYTDDAALVADLVDRVGPVTFDRLRASFAGDATDIALTTTAAAGERSPMPDPSPTPVSATVTTEDVRRAYYDTADWEYWITELQIDPTLQLIVTSDETGEYSRIPVVISGNTITFGEPVPVSVVYVDQAPTANATQVAAMTVMASAALSGQRVVYATRAESRPGVRPIAAETDDVTDVEQHPTDLPAAEPEPETDTTEDDMSDLSEIRSRLGLPDDADEATILAALDERLKQPTAPEPAPEREVVPEPVAASTGTAEYATELQRVSAELAEIKADRRLAARASLFDGAVRAGQIKPADRPTWEARYDKAPDVITDVLASIAPGTAIPIVAAGVTGVPDEVADDGTLTEAEQALFTTSAKG